MAVKMFLMPGETFLPHVPMTNLSLVSRSTPNNGTQTKRPYLSHFVDWNGGVNGAIESALADHIRQGAEVKVVGVREENRVDVLHVLFQLVDMTHVEKLVPTAIQQEAELVHLLENEVIGE